LSMGAEDVPPGYLTTHLMNVTLTTSFAGYISTILIPFKIWRGENKDLQLRINGGGNHEKSIFLSIPSTADAVLNFVNPHPPQIPDNFLVVQLGGQALNATFVQPVNFVRVSIEFMISVRHNHGPPTDEWKKKQASYATSILQEIIVAALGYQIIQPLSNEFLDEIERSPPWIHNIVGRSLEMCRNAKINSIVNQLLPQLRHIALQTQRNQGANLHSTAISLATLYKYPERATPQAGEDILRKIVSELTSSAPPATKIFLSKAISLRQFGIIGKF